MDGWMFWGGWTDKLVEGQQGVYGDGWSLYGVEGWITRWMEGYWGVYRLPG